MLKYGNDKITTGGLKLGTKIGADDARLSEVVFHSVFVTYLDDLMVLSQISVHCRNKRHKRRKLNSVFMKRKS